MLTKITLDRSYIHNGVTLGPGDVEVEDDVAADLRTAIKRAKKGDEAIANRKLGIDEREVQRRQQLAVKSADARPDAAQQPANPQPKQPPVQQPANPQPKK